MSVEAFLERVKGASLANYRENQVVKSFEQFLADFFANPYLHLRCAPQYLLEMLEQSGTNPLPPGQEGMSFKAFTSPATISPPPGAAPPSQGAPAEGAPSLLPGEDGLIGGERAQAALHGYLKSYAKKGRADKMILFHGPNGSGKTTVIECLARGLEAFSHTPEGVLLKFNWIFLEKEGRLERIGFDRLVDGPPPKSSLAELEEKEIGCRIGCELRDPPIFLVPREYRRALIEEAFASCDLPPRPGFNPAFFLDGDLCQKCRRIYDTLLNAYGGDWEKLTRHIQVERYYLSKRYRTGAVSIEPQMNVDATTRPFNSEEARNLPPSLRNLSLFEPVGDIIDANHGILEYSDFLKRPLEMNKYLLTTCERGTVNLPHILAYLNLVILGTTNEKHLCLFKRSPDFSSFKGRIELIPVPYLLRISKEVQIYKRHIRSFSRDRHVTPHTDCTAAFWAILTRLRKPSPRKYEGPLSAIVGRLGPIEKAKLYDRNEPPQDLKDDEKKLLQANVLALRREHDEDEGEFEGIFGTEYEGRRGASAREMMSALSQAAEDRNYKCLTPMAVFDALDDLCKDTSLYEFLRFPVDEGYHDVRKFLEDVMGEYVRAVTQEVFDSISLIDEGEYGRLFLEYFRHVKAFCSKEKVFNPTTNSYEPANIEFLESIEKLLKFSETPETFRSNIMMRIGARSLESPRAKIDYGEIFPGIFQALRDNFYRERNRMLTLIEQDVLKFDTDDFRLLSAGDQERVRDVLSRMESRYGYCRHCSKDVIAYVLKNRPGE